MSIYFYIYISLHIAATLIVIRMAWANSRTYKDKLELLRAISKEEWKDYAHSYLKVSYDQHMYCLVKFQDPWKLYDVELQKYITQIKKIKL